jgi:hypothetical protein
MAAACSSDATDPDNELTLAVSPVAVTITQGSSHAVSATVTRGVKFTGDVTLTVSPSIGITTVLSDVHTVGSVTSAVLSIVVDSLVQPGDHKLVVRATADGVDRATAELTVQVVALPLSNCVPGSGIVCEQWAVSATASSQYTLTQWAAHQATGRPNVQGCSDDPAAWASLQPDGMEWLELAYTHAVQPAEIRVYEVDGVSSIVKIEVKDAAGAYHTVFAADPVAGACPRVLVIPVTGVPSPISVVRLSIDQRQLRYWNEVDAVRLTGRP